MSDGQVRDFLAAYAPALAGELWQELAAPGQLALVRVPYLARLFVEQAATGGVRSLDPAALITGFVRQALRREVELGNPLLEPDTLLTERDVRRLLRPEGWATAYDLPERGVLVGGLTGLAHGMQAGGLPAAGGQTRLDYDDAVRLVDQPRAADILRAGIALGVVDEDPSADEVLFFHQLLQEYFAARGVARRPEPARAAAPWRVADVRPSLAETLAGLGPAERLPALAASGWEETMVMAAAMATDPDPFVRELAAVNLVLAARAAAAAEVQPRLDPATLDALRSALVARSRDPAADLRARIAAGLALGPLGDPRFATIDGPRGRFPSPRWWRWQAGPPGSAATACSSMWATPTPPTSHATRCAWLRTASAVSR